MQDSDNLNTFFYYSYSDYLITWNIVDNLTIPFVTLDGHDIQQSESNIVIKLRLLPTYSLAETFDVGRDTGTQVSGMYTGTFKFNRELDRVIFMVSDDNPSRVRKYSH